jgi:hypothetical protein
VVRTRARRAERDLAKAKAEFAYRRRFFNRGYLAPLRARVREQERDIRAIEREAERSKRQLASLFTPRKSRTNYQQRVAGRLTRQIERGETPSVSRRTPDVFDRYARRLDSIYGDAFEGMRAGDQFRFLSPEEKRRTIERARELHLQWVEAGQPKGGQFVGSRDFTIFYHEQF